LLTVVMLDQTLIIGRAIWIMISHRPDVAESAGGNTVQDIAFRGIIIARQNREG